MKIMDFGERFKLYLRSSALGAAELADEDSIADIYIKWLAEPADFLDGQSPQAYFAQMGAHELVNTMLDYIRHCVMLPDPLLDALAESAEAEPLLFGVLTGEFGSFDNASQLMSARINAAQLLNQRQSMRTPDTYITIVCSREYKDALADIAAQGLANMGAAVADKLMAALPGASVAGRECLLDMLADCSGDPNVARWIIGELEAHPERLQSYCEMLARFDYALVEAYDAVIAKLEDMMQSHLGYADYIAVKYAYESITGVPADEDFDYSEFDGDPDYERLKADRDEL
ncbi:hypothetical protein SDC9_111708 [bioreactor metagenome]|uniref:Uncharacterized protein n=1 Tax=bioreactor metagenome TaxID=1076179 RepID=A0A645BHH2_9ZZZZ